MGVTVGADRICLKAYAAERFDEWRHFPTRTVGAAKPPTGRLLVDPYSWHMPFTPQCNSRMFGRLPAAPTDKNNKEEPK